MILLLRLNSEVMCGFDVTGDSSQKPFIFEVVQSLPLSMHTPHQIVAYQVIMCIWYVKPFYLTEPELLLAYLSSPSEVILCPSTSICQLWVCCGVPAHFTADLLVPAAFGPQTSDCRVISRRHLYLWLASFGPLVTSI
jgi:hypothetical protein